LSDSAAVLRLLGLARRAGVLRMGAGPVLRALARERRGLVFLARDAGADLVRKVERDGSGHRVERIFDGQELADAFGREKLNVVSVHEPGFLKGLLEQLHD